MSQLLQLAKVSVDIQAKPILTDIELSLATGDILGLVGPSGCGKTTLLNTIAGFVEFKSGRIAIAEQNVIDADNIIPAEQRNIGMIFQDYALFPHLTVWQNIAFGINRLAKEQQQSRIDYLLQLLQLTDYAQRYPHQLSGGQQQRVAIARALAPQPKLLLLDEPFSNIDARLRNELMLELRSLLKTLKMTAIFVTHNKDEVFSFADKIAVMHQGKILQSGSPQLVFQQPNCWQVADFLQIGHWMPITLENGTMQCALGRLPCEKKTDAQKQKLSLLLKPQHIKLNSKGEANAMITHVKITERGFCYTLASLEPSSALAFKNLTFYSDQCFYLADKLALEIVPHDYALFAQA